MPCALGRNCLNRLELGGAILYHEYQQKAEADSAHSKPYEMIGGIVQPGERRRCRVSALHLTNSESLFIERVHSILPPSLRRSSLGVRLSAIRAELRSR